MSLVTKVRTMVRIRWHKEWLTSIRTKLAEEDAHEQGLQHSLRYLQEKQMKEHEGTAEKSKPHTLQGVRHDKLTAKELLRSARGRIASLEVRKERHESKLRELQPHTSSYPQED